VVSPRMTVSAGLAHSHEVILEWKFQK